MGNFLLTNERIFEMLINDATRITVRRVDQRHTGENSFTGGGASPARMCAKLPPFCVTVPPVFFCIRVATGNRSGGPVGEGERRDGLETTLLNTMPLGGKNINGGLSQSASIDKASMEYSGRGEINATATERPTGMQALYFAIGGIVSLKLAHSLPRCTTKQNRKSA